MPQPTILVVDDDRQVAGLVAAILEAQGYTVEKAFDGGEAHTLLTTRDYDLLITDVQMPVMNGIELVRQIRSCGSRIPVVVMSSMATGLTRDRARRLGAMAFLDKPFDPTTLLPLVADLLSSRETVAQPRGRVLVADDHQETGRLLCGVLLAAGYEVTCTQDGQDAIDEIQKAPAPFGFALIDLVMPKRNGVEVLDHLRASSPSTLAVVMTGEATSEEEGEVKRRGNCLLLRKPFEIDTLLRRLTEIETLRSQPNSPAATS